MNLLTLGTQQRRLFAIHETAAAHSGRVRAAVLCYPWGMEYLYAHRAMRLLSLKLAAAGFHTLRFDYYGTGDSAGTESEVTHSGCESDLESAMEALSDIVGTARLNLIGLRVGANIAAQVAARRNGAVESLVLWDPLAAGSGAFELPRGTLPAQTAIFVSDDRCSEAQVRDMGLAAKAPAATLEFLPGPATWLESTSITGLLPIAVIQRVVQWLQ